MRLCYSFIFKRYENNEKIGLSGLLNDIRATCVYRSAEINQRIKIFFLWFEKVVKYGKKLQHNDSDITNGFDFFTVHNFRGNLLDHRRK